MSVLYNRALSAPPARLLVVASLFISACSTTNGVGTAPANDVSAVVRAQDVDPRASALLIKRLDDGAEWHSGGARIDAPFPPASTSKIPHTLIALQSGYVDGPDSFFKWDGMERAFDFWNQDQTLASAYRYSAVWVYQRIVRDLGHDTMSQWMAQLDYGNRNIGSPDHLTSYWLVGPLETSARDQVAFLTRLANDALPFAPRTLRVGKSIMIADQGDNGTLYAKTGWRSDGVNVDIGWYVGWLEHVADGEKNTYVFAFNMDMPHAADRARRKSVVRAAFADLGIAFD